MNELNNVPENVEENAERESLRQNATEKKNLKRNRANSEPEKSRLASWFGGVSLFFLIVSLGTLLGSFLSNNADFKTSESVLASNVASDVSNVEQQTTKYVTKNIEDIQEGDEVLAYDVRASEHVKSKVSATFHLKSDHLRYLTVLDANGSEQTFQTTDTHPFWVNSDRPDLFRKARDSVSEYDVSTNSDINFEHDNLFVTESGYYVEAKDLKEGDRFIAPSGESSFLVKTWRESQPEGIDVYNFKVTDNSNYFVIAQYADFQNGAEPVLVHNAKDCHRKSAGRSDPHGDSGRELEKAYKQIEQYKKQIDELKQQHGTARKIKDIQNKIQRVQQEAQKKNKGETHWRRGK